MNGLRILLFVFNFCAVTVQAQLAVTVSPPKITGQKAVVLLALRNHLGENIESARAVCFLLDDKGQMVGQSTKWVIGDNANKSGLAAGTTNSFNFVISSPEPFSSTNLTAKVSFSQLVLEGGKQANVKQNVQIEELGSPNQKTHDIPGVFPNQDSSAKKQTNSH